MIASGQGSVVSGQNGSANGVAKIQEAFRKCRQSNKIALIPYITGGYPDTESFPEILKTVSEYADVIEVGIPFSDPMADGPTIQLASQRALESGANMDNILKAIKDLDTEIPVVIMAYYNSLFHYGLERFARTARDHGVSGTIIPDLIPEEAAEWERTAREHDLAIINLAAPTSSAFRVELAAKHSTGFLYCVSLTGITGARDKLSEDLPLFLQKASEACALDRQTPLPLAVGFGISTPEHVQSLKSYADGVIVGSSLVKQIDPDKDLATQQQAIAEYLSAMHDATDRKIN